MKLAETRAKKPRAAAAQEPALEFFYF
jgi:hypothetical protein